MTGKIDLIKRVAIIAIAGFLILLHVVGLIDTFSTGAMPDYSAFENLQSILSVFIILSLTLVIFRKRIGLIGMWVSITTLILTQYWAHFGFVDADFTQGRSVFSYLRGFMIPTAITLLHLLPLGQKS